MWNPNSSRKRGIKVLENDDRGGTCKDSDRPSQIFELVDDEMD